MTLPAALVGLAGPERRDDSALITDFDGTLAPIVDEPAAAAPLPAALAALEILSRELRLVAVISGRPVAFLRERIPVAGVELIGQYGVERLVDGEIVVDERVLPYLDAVAAAAADAGATWPELFIERKGRLAVGIHWRSTPEHAPALDALESLARRHGLTLHGARMAVELRPPVPVDKGTALTTVLEGFGSPQWVAFAGDDQGDLAVFDALDALDALDPRDAVGSRSAVSERVRIAVRSAEAPAELIERADLVLDGPGAVTALLVDLAAAVTAAR